jgi:8-oxo-dGTP diphosphatase
MTQKTIEVCAAVIENGGRFLLARRPDDSHLPGLWEFPGGKLHDGETLDECICREIREELGREIIARERIGVIEHSYPEKTVHLHFLACRLKRNDDEECPAAETEYGWFEPTQIHELELAAADRRFVDDLLSIESF